MESADCSLADVIGSGHLRVLPGARQKTPTVAAKLLSALAQEPG